MYICICVFMSYSHKLANGKTRRVMSREEFRLLHYAGEVNYNVNGKLKLITRSTSILLLLMHSCPCKK